MLRTKYIQTVKNAVEKNKTVILSDENVIPSNINVNMNKAEHVDFNKPNTIKYSRVCAKAEPLYLCNKKYKFTFIAPCRTNDKNSYYEMEYKSSIPKGYIRLVFCLKPSDTPSECRTYGVSRETWEASKSKYITIFSYKVKEGDEETQQSIMEELADYIQKKMYRNAKITVIDINNNEDSDE
jgi:hypothetical protein